MPSIIHGLPADLIDVAEASEVLRISKGTLYGWIQRGHLPHYRLGRLVRLSAHDLVRFLERERRTLGGGPQEHIGSP